MIKEYNFDEFDAVTRSEWMAKLNKDLGQDIASKISSWECERNLSLSAYFDKDDRPANSAVSIPVHTPWRYLQLIGSEDTSEQVTDALMNGADGVLLNDESIKDIDRSLEHVAPGHCTVALQSSNPGDYKKLLNWLDAKLDQSLSSDIFVLQISNTIHADTKRLVSLFEKSANRGHRVINLNGELIQKLGGSARLEIAYILAQGVYFINTLLDQGHTIEEIAERIIVSTSVGSNFFLELAKIRVIRKVIQRMLVAYGHRSCQFPIYASTSRLTQSALDKNTNFLRCTSEAMSAVLGGADYLTILPLHDLHFKQRIARNISNLLKEESLLAKTIDPASGSYYIESLSDQLAQNSWQLFRQIEKDGGFQSACDNGFFEEEIRKDWEFQMLKITSGKKKVVGVNDFGNQDESVAAGELEHAKLSYSKAFEEVRLTVESYTAQHGENKRPVVYLVAVGSNAKIINARYTFVTNFFTWAGIRVARLEEGKRPSEGSVVACCGADEDYTVELLGKTKTWQVPVLAAGREVPELADLISGWVNIKSNRLETVKEVLTEMGINQKETEI